MGNIFCGCLLDDDISKLDDEIKKLLDKKKSQKFGICGYCNRARICCNQTISKYNGEGIILICIECDKELKKEVLYIY